MSKMKETRQSRAGESEERPDLRDTQKQRDREVAELREPREVAAKEREVHPGFYRGPENQTLRAGHGERKTHEDHHPAVKMCKGKY